jgi:hypothetical protein
MVATSRELSMIVSGVKCTFLHYPFRVVHPFAVDVPLPILSAKELLATKAYTIGRRGSLKDYVDLWSGIDAGVATLADVVELADQKYGDVFNDRLFLEQLLYLDDVADEALVMRMHLQPSKSELQQFFSERIRELSIH